MFDQSMYVHVYVLRILPPICVYHHLLTVKLTANGIYTQIVVIFSISEGVCLL